MKDNLTKTLKPGEGFGEMALLYNAPRSAEIRCVNQCKLWGVDRITFRKALEEMITRNFEENRRFIENINFFGKTPTHSYLLISLDCMLSVQKDAVSGVLITETFFKGQEIVCEG